MIRSIDELRPEARAVAQGFLDAAAEVTARDLRAGVREDLASHLCERLDPASTAADVEQLLAAMRPEEVAGDLGGSRGVTAALAEAAREFDDVRGREERERGGAGDHRRAAIVARRSGRS